MTLPKDTTSVRWLARLRENALALSRAACLFIVLFALTLPRKIIFMVGDDGFYVFTIARNLARGNGMSVDGHTLTNGVQPLWAFLLVPLYWQRVVDPLRGILILSTGLLVGSAWLFGSIAVLVSPLVEPDVAASRSDDHRKKLVFWGGAALYLSTWQCFWLHFNNLETGLLLLLILLTLRTYLVMDFQDLRASALFGALLGGLVLARIDASFFVAAILLTTYLGLRRQQGSGPALAHVALAGAVASAVSAPWWIYNRVVFGHFMPTSGQAQQLWAVDGSRLQRMGVTLTSLGVPFLPMLQLVSNAHLVAKIALGAMVVLAVGGTVLLARAVYRRTSRTREPVTAAPTFSLDRRLEAFGVAFAFSLLMLIGYYTFGSFATWFYGRYLAPVLLGSMLVWLFVLRAMAQRRPWLTGAILALLLGSFAFQTVSMYRAWRPDSTEAERQMAVVREHVPVGETVAAGQSGMLGYFWDTTINMDGKVNAEALPFQRPGLAHEYLVQHQIHWYCDWKELVTLHLGSAPEERGWKLIARDGPWFLYHHDSENLVQRAPGKGDNL